MHTVRLVLVDHERLVDEVLAGTAPWRRLVSVLALMIGAPHLRSSPRDVANAASLVLRRPEAPLVLLLTSTLTMTFNWVVAVAFGMRIAFLKVCVLTFLTLAVAALVLASLAPVAWLMSACAPEPTPDARTTTTSSTSSTSFSSAVRESPGPRCSGLRFGGSLPSAVP